MWLETFSCRTCTLARASFTLRTNLRCCLAGLSVCRAPRIPSTWSKCTPKIIWTRRMSCVCAGSLKVCHVRLRVSHFPVSPCPRAGRCIRIHPQLAGAYHLILPCVPCASLCALLSFAYLLNIAASLPRPAHTQTADLGARRELGYKPDIFTKLGIYSGNRWHLKPTVYHA